MERNLIFDIGMHKADDARYYLQKGFQVVSLEANGDFIAEVSREFAAEIASAQFTIVEKALADRANETVTFYVNSIKDDWSSTIRGVAEKGLHTATERQVPTTTLHDLLAEFGTPYFIKCDIEGSDAVFVRQLSKAVQRPAFVSIEAMSNADLAMLLACGYDCFQIVNQQFISYSKPPEPPLEGRYAKHVFTAHMSGLFGLELPRDKWFDFDETVERFSLWTRLRGKDDQLAPGWLDFHATTRAALEGQV